MGLAASIGGIAAADAGFGGLAGMTAADFAAADAAAATAGTLGAGAAAADAGFGALADTAGVAGAAGAADAAGATAGTLGAADTGLGALADTAATSLGGAVPTTGVADTGLGALSNTATSLGAAPSVGGGISVPVGAGGVGTAAPAVAVPSNLGATDLTSAGFFDDGGGAATSAASPAASSPGQAASLLGGQPQSTSQLISEAANTAGSPGSITVANPQTGVDLGSLATGTPDKTTSLWDQITGAINSPTGKVLGVAASGAGLIKDLLGGGSPAGLSSLQNLAASSASQGQILQQYLQNGTLPPAVQASVNAATQNGITAIKSKYASMGVAPGSSAEVEDIARLQQNAVVQGATLADQLLAQGISETQLSAQLYNDIMQQSEAQTAQTGAAIGNLASALAGSNKIIIGSSS